MKVNGNQRSPARHSQKKQNTTQGRLTGTSYSWWYSPFVGYPLAVFLAACAFLIPWTERFLGVRDYFVVPPFVIATILVGWLWGVGPTLLALILELFALDYWFVPPLGTIDFFLWPDVVSFVPFIVIQLSVLGLVIIQKKYRQQLIGSNAQLHRANQVKDQFLSLASHELKTPITTIQGQVQLALRRLGRQQPLPPDFAYIPIHLKKVEEQTHRLQTLVNDLLSVSSLRSGKVPLRLASCDISLLCQRVVEDQGALANRSLDLRMPPRPVILQADEGRICQVVTNLVVNAIKYSTAHSTVCVELSQNETQVLFAVHNDGPVISQEEREKIFEPFYRTAEAQTSAAQGWGLGLGISKEIVEQHGGRIWAESAEGEGTTFIVELPLQNVCQGE